MVVLKLILVGYYLQCLLLYYVENAPGWVTLEEFCVKASRAFPKLSFTVCSGQNSRKYLVGTQEMLRLCPPAAKDNHTALRMTFCLYVRRLASHVTTSSVREWTWRWLMHLCFGMNQSVRVATEPFSCVDSPSCSMWHMLARNASIFEDMDSDNVMCQPCKKMHSHLDQCVLSISSSHPLWRKLLMLNPLLSPLFLLLVWISEGRIWWSSELRIRLSESMSIPKLHWMIKVMKWLLIVMWSILDHLIPCLKYFKRLKGKEKVVWKKYYGEMVWGQIKKNLRRISLEIIRCCMVRIWLLGHKDHSLYM